MQLELKEGSVWYNREDLKPYKVQPAKLGDSSFRLIGVIDLKEEYAPMYMAENDFFNKWSSTKEQAVRNKIQQLEKQAATLKIQYL